MRTASRGPDEDGSSWSLRVQGDKEDEGWGWLKRDKRTGVGKSASEGQEVRKAADLRNKAG